MEDKTKPFQKAKQGKLKAPPQPEYYTTIYRLVCEGFDSGYQEFEVVVEWIKTLPGRVSVYNLEATTGFEPVNKGFADPRLATWLRRLYSLGAEDEIRTRDPLLGKEMLYH